MKVSKWDCAQTLINENCNLEREVKNRAEWEKSIKEAKVRIGLQCHLRRRKITTFFSYC